MRKDAKDSEEPPGPRGHVTFATRTIGYSGVLRGEPFQAMSQAPGIGRATPTLWPRISSIWQAAAPPAGHTLEPADVLTASAPGHARGWLRTCHGPAAGIRSEPRYARVRRGPCLH